jgi:excisionase family DNA binding protein
MAGRADHPDGGSLLSPEQVARRCGLSRRAVYEAIKRGELRACRLCSRLRISADHLDAWLRESAVTASPPFPQTQTRPEATVELARRGSFRARLAASNGQRE